MRSEYSHIEEMEFEENEVGRETGRTVFDEILDRIFSSEQNFNKNLLEVKASHASHMEEVKQALYSQETNISTCLNVKESIQLL